MKRGFARSAASLLALALTAVVGAPYLNADQYGLRLKWSLQAALGRRGGYRRGAFQPVDRARPFPWCATAPGREW